MSSSSFLLPYTDALRAWGFCAGLCAAPDAWGLIRRAVPKALKEHGTKRTLLALWHEGDNWVVNGWTLVLLAVMLLIAGSGIPLAHFLGISTEHPTYLAVVNVSWLCLSAAGWNYNIATAKRQQLMVGAAVLLLFLLTLGAVFTANV